MSNPRPLTRPEQVYEDEANRGMYKQINRQNRISFMIQAIVFPLLFGCLCLIAAGFLKTGVDWLW